MQQNHLQQILLRTRQQQAEQQLNPNQPSTATTNPTNPAAPTPAGPTGLASIDPILLSVPTPTQNNDNNNNQNLLLNHRWENYYLNQRMPDLRNRALNIAINLRNFLADNVFGVGVVNNDNNNGNFVRRRVRMINLRNLQQINLGSIQIVPTINVQPIEELAEGVVGGGAVETAVETPTVSSTETMDDRSNYQRNFEENNFIFAEGAQQENRGENVAAPVTIEGNENLYYSVAPVAQKNELNLATSETSNRNLNAVDGNRREVSSISDENKTIETTIDKIKLDECSSAEMNSSLNDNGGNCNSSIEGNSSRAARAFVQDEQKISSKTNDLKIEEPGDEN